MLLKRVGPWVLLLIIVGTVFSFKVWQQRSASTTSSLTDVNGPAVILFRGDNSTNCQAIHRLVDEAETRHGKQVHFAQFDWSDDNPLIKKYRIHFLPTVVFLNQQNKEVGRIVGESPAVQQKLKQALAQVDDLVMR
jgi:thiol-disulfide isomerase/thioredoxin